MTTPTYPSGVRVFIDEEDVTYTIFGAEKLTLSDVYHTFDDIDITPYLKFEGRHKLSVTADGGVGRLEARIVLK